MAKRFMTTELFEDAWFMDLPAKYKLFWIYLLTRCTNAGIWQVNWKLAQFYVGDNLEPTEVKRIFNDRIKEFEEGKYWFIPKFIQFQYGDRLSKNNPATKKVIEELNKLKLFDFALKTKIYEGASKELQSTLQGAQDKDKYKYKEEDKDKVKDKVKYGDDVFLTEAEYQKLCNSQGQIIANKCIVKLDNYKGSTGKKYKSDYKAILNWVLDEVKKGGNNGADKQQAIRGSVDIDKWQKELDTIKPRST